MTRAVLSFVIALILAVAPPMSSAATCAMGASDKGMQHDAVSQTEDHRAHAMHAGSHEQATSVSAKVNVDMPVCVDHDNCKGSCAAHCLSMPVSIAQFTFRNDAIQVSQARALGPDFSPDTPSRPPKILL